MPDHNILASHPPQITQDVSGPNPLISSDQNPVIAISLAPWVLLLDTVTALNM
jgi:hypothetical protein